MNQLLLDHIEQLKKSATGLAQALPKMVEDAYERMSPKHRDAFLKHLNDGELQEKVKDISEKIKEMNKVK